MPNKKRRTIEESENSASISILLEKSNIFTLLILSAFLDFQALQPILISMIRIWFFWTPSLAASVLSDVLSASGIEVAFVVTNPDKPIGRDARLSPTPVKELALKHALPVFTPEKIRGNMELFEILRAYVCDYFIVVAYGRILPNDILDMPTKMCINIHGSILPKYRWASPIQSVLLCGEEKTGVTIMKMSEWMDEGDILKIREITISDDETSWTLFEKFADISWYTLIDTLKELEHGGITPLPQDQSQATYCTKISKEDGLIDWKLPSKEIYQKWQAYTPWPGIYTMYEGKRFLLEGVKYQVSSSKNNGNPGMVIKNENGDIGVVCGEWVLTLEQVKLEWKKSQHIKDFVNGNQQFISYQFSLWKQ